MGDYYRRQHGLNTMDDNQFEPDQIDELRIGFICGLFIGALIVGTIALFYLCS